MDVNKSYAFQPGSAEWNGCSATERSTSSRSLRRSSSEGTPSCSILLLAAPNAGEAKTKSGFSSAACCDRRRVNALQSESCQFIRASKTSARNRVLPSHRERMHRKKAFLRSRRCRPWTVSLLNVIDGWRSYVESADWIELEEFGSFHSPYTLSTTYLSGANCLMFTDPFRSSERARRFSLRPRSLRVASG